MSVLVLAACPPDDDVAPTQAPAAPSAAVDESTLLVAARAGDLRAFEGLYRGHVGKLSALCRRLCADVSAADELVQQTFVRAWEHLATFRGQARFATWLARVAVHLFLDERRARQRSPQLVDGAELDRSPATTAGAAPPSLTADRFGDRCDLERALLALPPRARAVFVLHDIEGHRHEEIAAIMGVDVGTSKSQLHRARRLLREALR